MRHWIRRYPAIIVMLAVVLAWIVPQGLVFTPPKLLNFAVSLGLGAVAAMAWDKR